MGKETYILIGLCVFAFLVGSRVKKALQTKDKTNTKKKNKQHSTKTISPRKIKLQRVFTIILLVFVFGLLIFMIPALTRGLLTNNGAFSENLILRIIIVAFSVYILLMGYMKLRK